MIYYFSSVIIIADHHQDDLRDSDQRTPDRRHMTGNNNKRLAKSLYCHISVHTFGNHVRERPRSACITHEFLHMSWSKKFGLTRLCDPDFGVELDHAASGLLGLMLLQVLDVFGCELQQVMRASA